MSQREAEGECKDGISQPAFPEHLPHPLDVCQTHKPDSSAAAPGAAARCLS